MDLIIVDDYLALSRAAADLIGRTIREIPTAAVVVATGSTPMGVYRELEERHRRGEIDTSNLRVFQLDEYLDLDPTDRRSLYGWMMRSFVEPLGIDPNNVVRLPDNPPDHSAACRSFDAAVAAAGGIDLAILGLGPNGHLGFNEPPAGPDERTRVVALTEASIESNGAYWGGSNQVPRRAVTAGMATLLAARRTLLVVSGTHKREILHRTVGDSPTPEVPASFLQRAAGVTVIADREAWGEGPSTFDTGTDSSSP